MVFDQQFKLKGTWGEQLTDYGYDFWFAPSLRLQKALCICAEPASA